MAAVEQGLRLRESRIGRGWSVQTASLAAGVSPATLKRWESGKGFPQVRALRGYLGALGLTPRDLDAGETGLVVQRLLRAKRRRTGHSLAEVSAAAGVSVSCLQRYESGLREMDETVAGLVGRAYGCSDTEIQILTGREQAGEGEILPRFLAPGQSPHAFLYRRLDNLVSGVAATSVDAALDILHAFMVMGDHAEALFAWSSLEPLVSVSDMARHDRSVVAATLALARATSNHDLGPGRRLLAANSDKKDAFPLAAMSHMSRLASMDGDSGLAWQWNTLLSRTAREAGASGQVFISRMQKVVLDCERTPDSREEFRRLRTLCEVPLQNYTLAVAELGVLAKAGLVDETANVLRQCRELESIYGFGSPLARQVGRRLVQTKAQSVDVKKVSRR